MLTAWLQRFGVSSMRESALAVAVLLFVHSARLQQGDGECLG